MSGSERSKNKQCSPELLETLAKNVKRLRVKKGISQESLGDKSDLHRTFISMIERGGNNVTLGVLEALANALEVDVATLLTKANEK